MESKHTPGPWESTIVHGESRSIKCVMADGPTQVCVLTEGTMEDARLIAAAPELLAALLTVRDRLSAWADSHRIYFEQHNKPSDKYARDNYDHLVNEVINPAIAKAEGR
jgi:hypothetical protein